MPPITFATGNTNKFGAAKLLCAEFGITVLQDTHDIDEIQGDNPERIAHDKAAKAYALCQQPIVVVDDSWEIPALRGFPGPYMKDVNRWFQPEDFLRLMSGITDRRVFLHQYLVYQDARQAKLFQSKIPGKILHEARGHHPTMPSTSVVALDTENGRTIAEAYEAGEHHKPDRYKARGDVWLAFAQWYKELHD